jgi:cytochrome P450
MTMPRRTIGPDELDTLDLADPRLHAESELSALWRHLREHQPVHWNPATGSAPGFWVVTRHADVTSVYRDSARFTSEGGNVLETLLAGGDTAAGRMLAITDGDRHAGLRRLLMSVFSPRALKPVVTSVQRTVTRLLRDAVDKGGCDFAADVAAGVPLGAICDLPGVPESDRDHVLSLTSSALGSHDADSTAADAWIARNEILLYFAGLARDRRDGGHTDVIALLAGSEVNGLPLDDDEIMLNCYSLILGGDETARLSMVGAALALLDHPGQWRALKRGDASIDTAVEENPALDHPRPARGAHRDGRHRDRRPTDQGRGDRHRLERLRQPRRTDLRHLRRAAPGPHLQQTRHLRPRPALLPRRPPGPRRHRGRTDRAARPRRRYGADGSRTAGLLHLPQRPQLTATGPQGRVTDRG